MRPQHLEKPAGIEHRPGLLERDRRAAAPIAAHRHAAPALLLLLPPFPCGRYTALERTPCHGHALADARAYAGRHRIPVSVLAQPLAVILDRSVPSQRRRGEIGIWRDPAGSGWQVERANERGGCIGIVGRSASLDEAVAIARDAARRLGATFDEGDAA